MPGRQQEQHCHAPLSKPLQINGKEVEQVPCFKYLGMEIDQTISFSGHGEAVYKKAQQRLFLLWKLRCQRRDPEQFIPSSHRKCTNLQHCVLVGSLVCEEQNPNSPEWSTREPKITGCTQTQLPERHAKAENTTLDDTSHPLRTFFEMMPSGQSYRVPSARRCFIPTAIAHQLSRDLRTH